MKDSTSKDEILYFSIYKEEYAEKFNLFYKDIAELSKNIKNRGIVNKEFKKSWFAKQAKFLNIKFINTPMPGNIDILRDKVLITSWMPEITTVLIHSQDIASNFKNYFNEVWQTAK
jgi:hypothetical protein